LSVSRDAVEIHEARRRGGAQAVRPRRRWRPHLAGRKAPFGDSR
jgi:hypothetical protein